MEGEKTMLETGIKGEATEIVTEKNTAASCFCNTGNDCINGAGCLPQRGRRT